MIQFQLAIIVRQANKLAHTLAQAAVLHKWNKLFGCSYFKEF